MRILLALFLGIAIGATALWFFTSERGKTQLRDAGAEVKSATKPARDAIQDQIQVLHLRPQDIRDELDKGGQVVRRKAKEAGQAIADATADARITATIKGKLIADPALSAMSISVNTTAGVVTLSGSVSSPEEVSKAMVLAMQVEGVREVISTLQVRAPAAKK